MNKHLKILMLGSEVAPFSKAGGLGDVLRSLPKALMNLGHEVIVATPLHGGVAEKYLLSMAITNLRVSFGGRQVVTAFQEGLIDKKVPVYFMDHNDLFGRYKHVYGHDDAMRFLFFSLASIELVKQLNFQPDIIHCNDWHTALIPYFLKKFFAKDKFFSKTATLLTIHNLAFQGEEPDRPKENKNDYPKYRRHSLPEDLKEIKKVNFMSFGIVFANIINTVSERYAREILTKEYGVGLEGLLKRYRHKLFGIINGLDSSVFNPALDPNIPYKFDVKRLSRKYLNKKILQKKLGLPPERNAPILAFVSRITEQKGFDLFMAISDTILQLPIQVVMVGSGAKRFHNFWQRLAKKYPDKVGVHLEFSQELASLVYAGADIFLMPSRFEPSGLGQMIALRYGTIPIVRATGGLSDTISDYNSVTGEGTGFVFERYDPVDFLVTIIRALEVYKDRKTWHKLMNQGMRAGFSWRVPARKYVVLYKKAIKKRRR
ncbi:glycogen synthase [Candidatus Berkelbacteria bacterium]|nr:glycogen synthase [Candidatus Berkelbacteria bacterium]MBI4029590.1 glycogen synthase [Candidatus Berkelbacteria bacterium]